MIRLTYCILVAFLIINCSKQNNSDYIKIINSSNQSIFADIQYNYPDTLIVDSDLNITDVTKEILSNSFTEITLYVASWEEIIKQRNSFETVTFFFISTDTIDKYSFDEVKKNYNILERRHLNIEELKRSNWTVIYPN